MSNTRREATSIRQMASPSRESPRMSREVAPTSVRAALTRQPATPSREVVSPCSVPRVSREVVATSIRASPSREPLRNVSYPSIRAKVSREVVATSNRASPSREVATLSLRSMPSKEQTSQVAASAVPTICPSREVTSQRTVVLPSKEPVRPPVLSREACVKQPAAVMSSTTMTPIDSDNTLRGVASIVSEVDDTAVSGVEQAPADPAPWYCPRNSDDLHHTFTKVIESKVFMAFRFFILIVPGFMIYLGVVHWDNCPVRRQIPMWGAVAGGLWTIHTLFYFIFRNSPDKGTMNCRLLEAIFFYTAFTWLVCGTVWVLGKVNEVNMQNKEVGNYCNVHVYLLNVCVLGLVYLVGGGTLFIFRFTYNQDYYEEE